MPALLLAVCFSACTEEPLRTIPAGDSFRNGIVVSADSLASAVGVSVLKRGGNAVDAAVAVGFALAVSYPEAGNLGGGGFMLLRLVDGTGVVIDFRETAPSLATSEMFLDSTGAEIPGASVTGPRSAGVPGTVAGLLLALERYGTISRTAALRPAIELADRGFAVGHRLAGSLEAEKEGIANTGAINVFGNGERVLREGELLQQKELSAVLRRISRKGSPGFYEGTTANLIVKSMEPGGGIISPDDLRNYRPVEREALAGTYRGYEILTVPPPSFGGVIVLEMLNILENFDLMSYEADAPVVFHLVSSSAQFAFLDRFRYAGDPDHVDVPVDDLLSKEIAAERSRTIDIHRSLPPGGPGQTTLRTGETTNYCVADSLGNIVAVTTSLNNVYGGKVFVRGTGFFLNNVMDDFVVKPGVPNLYGLTGGEANAIAPYRRMVSSMAPVIVLNDGNPRLVLGGRGGSRIPTSVVQVVLNVIDFGLSLEEAISLPRVHHQWDPDTLYYDLPSFPKESVDGLLRLGYPVARLRSSPGRLQAFEVREGAFHGVPDPREGGAAGGF